MEQVININQKVKIVKHLSSTIIISAALAGLSSAAVVGGATAAGYNFSLTPVGQSGSGSFALKQFDSSLGTLTGVSISFSMVDWNSAYTFTHSEDVTLIGGSTGGARVGFKLFGSASNLLQLRADQELVSEDTFYEGSGTESITGLSAVTKTGVSNQNATWAGANGFIGTGTRDFAFSASQVQSVSTAGLSLSNVLTQDMSGGVSAFVTYTYDEVAAVPEPSGLLLGGVPALVMLMSRRRAVRKDPA